MQTAEGRGGARGRSGGGGRAPIVQGRSRRAWGREPRDLAKKSGGEKHGRGTGDGARLRKYNIGYARISKPLLCGQDDRGHSL